MDLESASVRKHVKKELGQYQPFLPHGRVKIDIATAHQNVNKTFTYLYTLPRQPISSLCCALQQILKTAVQDIIIII